MALFTFIMEYCGGTYCSQVEARDPVSALSPWIEKLESQIEEIDELHTSYLPDLRRQLLTGDTDEAPAPLTGLKNTWFFMVTTPAGVGMVNLIKTVGDDYETQ